MNKKIIILAILLMTIWFSCEKQLNITDFKEDFGNYESELKVEGVLQLDSPKSSIIRIIKSSPVTDTDIFDGKDDDNDGEIDEYDEILPLVQDTSATVKVRNLATDEVWDFQYIMEADSFYWDSDNDDMNSNSIANVVKYGAYKPKSSSFHLEPLTEYQLEVYSKDFDKTIIGTTTLYPAVEFIDTLFNFQDSIATVQDDDEIEIFWKSAKEVTAYYITYEEVYEIAEDEYAVDFLFSYKGTIDQETNKKYTNVSIGKETVWGIGSNTIIRLTVEAMSPEYGKYMFSSLPLNDPNRTNLKDENGNPVMGCFGGSAAKYIYIVVED